MRSDLANLHDSVELAVSPRLAELCQRMRASGAHCGIDDLITAHHALVHVEPTRAGTRAALRCVLCASHREVAAFDAAFDAVFGEPLPVPPEMPLKPEDVEPPATEAKPGEDPQASAEMSRGSVDPEALQGDTPTADDEPVASALRWSEREILRDKDFRAYTVADRVVARSLLRRLAMAMPMRRSGRWRPVHGRGDRLDVAQTIRVSLRAGGEPLDLRFRSPSTTARRLVLVCDVSGSMAPYSSMLLEYVHAAICSGRRVEAFCFATRLARVTSDLRIRDADRAIARAEARLPDRSGGTRIGAALAQLNREHGRRLGRGAVVVILSDGWDRGEPGVLSREMARLRRSAHRVLWLDPRQGTPGYEPLTRGMREAMPHADRLMPGHSLSSVEELATVLQDELS
jgi:uncharacterized protein with von Willebrand factor type A (vWA) domain